MSFTKRTKSDAPKFTIKATYGSKKNYFCLQFETDLSDDVWEIPVLDGEWHPYWDEYNAIGETLEDMKRTLGLDFKADNWKWDLSNEVSLTPFAGDKPGQNFQWHFPIPLKNTHLFGMIYHKLRNGENL